VPPSSNLRLNQKTGLRNKTTRQNKAAPVNQIESEQSSMTQIQNPSFRLIYGLEYTAWAMAGQFGRTR
jgi:hypothetical protein